MKGYKAITSLNVFEFGGRGVPKQPFFLFVDAYRYIVHVCASSDQTSMLLPPFLSIRRKKMGTTIKESQVLPPSRCIGPACIPKLLF
jgi:hypothetical protein